MRNRIVLANYLQGVDELELKFTKTKQLEDIKNKIVNKLIGFEVIKQTSNSIAFKDFSSDVKQDIYMIIRRIFLIIESMSDELIKALENNRKDLTYIIEMDKETNKMAYYGIRTLNKVGYKESKKTPFLYSIMLCLENIGDLYRDIALQIAKNKFQLTKKDIENIKLVNKFFIIFREVFFEFKNEKLSSWAEFYEMIKNKFLVREKRGKSFLFLDNYLPQIIENILMMNNNLLMII